MLDYLEFDEKVNKGRFESCYLFCGIDEKLMKETIEKIVNKTVSPDFLPLNYSIFDGSTVDSDTIMNACETLPFMAEKKVVVVHRAVFLEDKDDKRFDAISKYIEKVPPHCILMMYYVYENDREKPSNKLKRLEKKACTVKFEKLKGAALQRKVKEIFEGKGKEIGKVELSLFCEMVDNNMYILNQEIEKLCCYTEERDIKRDDILSMLPQKSENDIFDLVDQLAQRKPEKAIDILNELIFKGEKIPRILTMVERQFKLLYSLRLGMEEGKGKEQLTSELKLHPYICEKMMTQSKRFGMDALKRNIALCLDTEKSIKSTSSDNKIEMELLFVNTMRA